MKKILGLREIEGKLLLREEELQIQYNIFRWWPTNKVLQVLTDFENGVNITLFDQKRREKNETNMKWVPADYGFHIQWDIEGKWYEGGDEIKMYWDYLNDQLCYLVVYSNINLKKWTMRKMLELRDINEGTLLLKEGEVDIQKKLFDCWPESKIRKVRTDIEKGVNITLFDVRKSRKMETSVKWVGCDGGFHVKWDTNGKGYRVGDSIFMYWDRKTRELCYEVLK